jgi:shikimate kinase
MDDRIDGIYDFALSKSIVLVGLMGAGKSSIGRKLAEVLGLPFRDSDEIIEKSAECSVSEVYELWGEKEFRSLESSVIKELLNGQICVLSTGDGAFLFNQEIISQNSVSIWINADIDLLHKRVVHRDTRPQLLVDHPTIEVLQSLLKEREPVYSKANIVVESYDEPYKVTVHRILKAMQNYFKSNSLTFADSIEDSITERRK